MKTKLFFISLLIFCIGQTNAQLNIGDTFNDGALTYQVKNLSPSEVSVIGFSATAVTNLIIPSTASSGSQTFSVVGVGPNAFQAKGIVTVEFPTTLQFIQDFAFQGNGPTLTSFNITNPASLNYIGRSVFAGCTGLQSADLSGISADLSASVSMFNNCTSITSFTMKNNTAVTTIPAAFLGTCSAMSVADFSGCSNITTFSDNVFRNNTSLTTLYLGTDTPPSISTTTNAQTFAYVNNGGLSSANRTLYLPTNTGVSNFSANALWTNIFGNFQAQALPTVGDIFDYGVLSYKIENLSPAEVSVIGFSGATVSNLVIPSMVSYSRQTFTVIGINASAFKQKLGLVSVEFPTTLTFIGDTAFQQTETLESFNISNPNVLTSLGRAIFDGCTDLQSADLSGISADLSTSDGMFNNCALLTAFTMKNNTQTTTVPAAFLGSCSAMTIADFSGCTNITAFSDNVFRNNTSLTTVYLGSDTPPSLSFTTNNQTFALVNDGGLTNADRTLYLPTNTGVTNFSAISAWRDIFGNLQIQPQVGDTFNYSPLTYKIENTNPTEVSVIGFSGATIANLVIPSSVPYSGQAYAVIGIGVSAFKQKPGLVSVEFPSTLRYIQDTAFQQTATLESFDLTNPSVLTSLGRAIFDGCTGLLSVDFSNISADLVTSDSMFNNCTSLTSFTMTNNTSATTIPASFLGTCSALTVADFTGCTNITTFSDNVFRNNTSLTTIYLGINTPPSLSNTSDAQTFAYVNNGGLTNVDRTLYVPTNTGVSNYSAISQWTDIFGTIRIKGTQQVTARPLIWVKDSEKQAILDEINNNTWKILYYNSFKNRVDKERASYLADRQTYLKLLPFNNTNAVVGVIPPLKTITDSQTTAGADRARIKKHLQSGVDSGVMYYLTGDVEYAKYSASIFYTFMKGMNQVPLSTSGNFNAGWIYPADHLREARDIGAQMPIIYDFIATFIKNGGTAYDFASDTEVTINIVEAEKVFINYVFLAKNRGGITSNWPALESPSLACNILALDSKATRDAEILYVINKTATRQIPLSTMSKMVTDNDGIWPEPFSYAKYVAEYSTYLMAVITKYNPVYDLANKYSNIPFSLEIPNDFSYPNGNRTLHFGDGSRGFSRYTDGYEMSYFLGKLTNNTPLLDKFGKLINSSISFGNYQRQTLSSTYPTAVEPYFDEPLRLLWFSGKVEGESTNFTQNVTNELQFAGITMQRNLSTASVTDNSLMLFVGGAGFIHSYASGMNMELYGPRSVYGAAAGNTQRYTSTIHRNYYRLFAAHNTVVVNGSSIGTGGNAGININTVKKLSLEPEIKEIPVSPNNSFSTSSFLDDRGTLAEATQNRTMAIVRTSPTTGYYVDVFKSNSSLANEYHDYIYHNIGTSFDLQSNGANLTLTTQDDRYTKGVSSGGFAHPGWQYFTDAKTTGIFSGDITATFNVTKIGAPVAVGMKMFMPGEANREYTTALAPPTLSITSTYNIEKTPTVIVRQNGEAWKTPFAAVYEPFYDTSSVTKVSSIKRADGFSGLEVESTVGGKNIKQIILVTDTDDGVFNDTALDVEFTGRFVVLSLDENNELTSIYMGKGSHIKYKGWDISSQDGNATSFYVAIDNSNATITTNSQLVYTYPSSTTITSENLINNTLSISDNTFNDSDKTFICYQNKASNTWNFEINNIEMNRNTNLNIVNLLGQTVLTRKIEEPLTEVNLGFLSSGLYIALITNNNSIVASKKIIIRN